MPVLKHAKKKLRQDKKRTLHNKKLRDLYKKLIKKARQARTPEAVSAAFKQIDKAAKHKLIHENKAARLKASLSQALSGEAPAPARNATPARSDAASSGEQSVAGGKPAAKKTEKKKAKPKATPKKSSKSTKSK